MLVRSNAENAAIDDLCRRLKDLDSVNKQLQAEETSLDDVRILFDLVVESFESARDPLSKTAAVVHHPHFEDGIVKLRGNHVIELQELERTAVMCFQTGCENVAVPKECVSFAAQALKRRRFTQTAADEGYIDTRFILSTDNIVDCLFSKG